MFGPASYSDDPFQAERPFVKLLIIGGPYRKTEFTVGEAGAAIGSSDACDLCLKQDLSVSALHVRIDLREQFWCLRDCDSGCGTFLLVEDAGCSVNMGDVFRMARCEVQVLAVPDTK